MNVSADMRSTLLQKKKELGGRLERVTENVRRGFESDSRERAQQFEDREVVDALGNEAREELAKISAALERMKNGDYGTCANCGAPVGDKRLEAYPYALECIDCAKLEEYRTRR